MRTIFLLVIFASVVVGHKAHAAEQCDQVRFGTVDWTDVKATTAVASELLQALGYEVDISNQSVVDTYNAMANGDIDVFLGNWMPSMAPLADPLIKDQKVERLVFRPVNSLAHVCYNRNRQTAIKGSHCAQTRSAI